MRKTIIALAAVCTLLTVPTDSEARGPALTIKNVSRTRLVFYLKVAGRTRWDKKWIAAGASRDYWATNKRSTAFDVKIITIMRSGRRVTKQYRLYAGFTYKVKPIRGVWDFRKSRGTKGPALSIWNTTSQRLVFYLKVRGRATWDKKWIGARKKVKYWATNKRSRAFQVKIITITRSGRRVKKIYNLFAGFRYKVKNIRGVYDFRKY
jgi:hypothetical protein